MTDNSNLISESALKDLILVMKEKKYRLVTAESLTAGMISATLANIPGASAVLNGGFTVYQDRMKELILGVSKSVLDEFTAVSAPVARQMALGALQATGHDTLGPESSSIAVAVTGYAGSPGGLAQEEDSGLVFIALADTIKNAQSVVVHQHHFEGNRQQVRQETTNRAIQYVIDLVKE